MKLGIMQPYLFPYIGYFQLIHAVDVFILYNDVQFIKGGWINRNNILINGKKTMFVFSLQADSTFLNINERLFDKTKLEYEKLKFLKTLSLAYVKAPFYKEVYDFIVSIIESINLNVSKSIEITLIEICSKLNINTKIINSENINYNREKSAEEKVIEICKLTGAETYLNSIGGIDLYNKITFAENNINLNFIKTDEIKYKQLNDNFIPNLSIIDVLMFNGFKGTSDLLKKFEII